MRQGIKNAREKHGDTARVVLFDLAALSVSAFLLWSARNASSAKKAVSAVCGLSLIGLAHKAANYLATPKVQPATAEAHNSKESQTQDNPNALVRPATP